MHVCEEIALVLPAISSIWITCSAVLACTGEFAVGPMETERAWVRANRTSPTVTTFTTTADVTAADSVRSFAETRVPAIVTERPLGTDMLTSKTKLLLRNEYKVELLYSRFSVISSRTSATSSDVVT